MNIADIAQRRYTTKAFDAKRRIPEDTVNALREVLRNAPSSVNSQPWQYLVAATEVGKAKIAQGMQGRFAYNAPKVLNASHVLVMCAHNQLLEPHLTAVVEQESQDGRFATPEARANQDTLRRNYVELHRNTLSDEREWIEKQLYLALGALLLAAGTLEVDACAMEGFDSAALDSALRLDEQGLHSVVVVALGYRSDEDFNARLPKSRLPSSKLFADV